MAGPGHKLIVHFMRHAAVSLEVLYQFSSSQYRDILTYILQPLHKINQETDITIRDPGLSPKGEQQCEEFCDAFEGQAKYINYVFASPMTRTLQTACYAFKEVIIPVIAMPQLQNLDSGPNGSGLDRDELVNRYNGKDLDKGKFGLPQGWVDTCLIPKDWNLKETGQWSADEVQGRLDHMRGFLQAIWLAHSFGKHRVEVVIVTHGSFLQKLVKDGTPLLPKINAYAEI